MKLDLNYQIVAFTI